MCVVKGLRQVRRSSQWFHYWRCIKAGTLSRIACHLVSSRVRIRCTHKCGAGEGDDGSHQSYNCVLWKVIGFQIGMKVRRQRAWTSVERVTTGHMRCGAAPEAPWKCVQRDRDPPHRLQVDQWHDAMLDYGRLPQRFLVKFEKLAQLWEC